jgi:2-C-methyl-D-erythritol 2,4-cyclodiphosphate synthase
LRIGQGFDVHRLIEGRDLILGGVKIEHPFGLEGHSDADVLLHAVIDALFGAAGIGDIGMHFPDTDPAYKDISSLELLKIAVDAVQSLGFSIENLDVTLVAQEPRIGRYRGYMVENLANVTCLDPSRVNVKATTTEMLGFLGRKEGMAALAIVLLAEEPSDPNDLQAVET